MADPQTQRDVKLTLPIEAADGLMSAFMPTGPLTPTTPMPATPPARPTFTRTAAPPAGPAPAVPAAPAPTGALPPIASAPSPASLPPPAGSHIQAVPDAPQKSTLQKIGGTLGRIGGYALGAIAPGVAAQIPSTPLGKIAAQNRGLRQGEVAAETGQKVAATDLARAGASRDVAETAKLEQETTNLREGGGWKDTGTPMVADDGKIYVVQQNARGENRLHPVDTSSVGGGGGTAAPTAVPAPGAGGVSGAAPGAPAPAGVPTFTKLGTAPKEADEPFGDPTQANSEFLSRYQVLHPEAKTLPPEYSLPANAKQKDYTRIKEALGGTEAAEGTAAARKSAEAAREAARGTRDLARQEKLQNDLNREVDKARAEMDKDLKPINDKMENLNEAMGMLENPNGMKDALVVVKSLVASAGGQGSGVRITMPEINRLAGARGIVGSVEALFNKAINGETLTDTQRQQLSGLLGDIRDRMQQKMTIASDAMNSITNATDVKDIRKAQTELNKRMQEFNKSGPAAQGAKTPPKVGDVVKGYTFKGGDPSDKASWEKAATTPK